MKNIEIPHIEDRGKRYRFFEILPGMLSWTILAMPFVLAILAPAASAGFIIAYLLLWLAKVTGMNVRALQGHRTVQKSMKLPWGQFVDDVQKRKVSEEYEKLPKWHLENIERIRQTPPVVDPDDVLHVAMIAAWNESREVLEPTIKSVIDSDYDAKKIILVLAYEERGGASIEKTVKDLAKEYKGVFYHAMTVKHVDQPGEVIGKGGNITCAGRAVQKYLEKEKIDPLRVVVTTLDSDNRPHKSYFGALTYMYCVAPDPVHVSFQPIAMYTNNIWDAPAPMRVIATGNSLWNTVLSLRQHIIRNFSAHAQGMQALIETDFWSVRTIVEDGHQFWRSYFRFDGKYEVYPMYLPIYQDAVLSDTYWKTLKAQFIQLRRWAWGASDVAYVAETGFFKRNKVPKLDLVFKFFRLLEGHISWATAALLITTAAFIPAFLNPQDYTSVQLPLIVSRIQNIALLGIFVTLFFSLRTLPPKPARYRRHRTLLMIAQWLFLPVTTIGYHALAAINSQTRLMFGWYLGKFDLTEKAVVTEDKKRII